MTFSPELEAKFAKMIQNYPPGRQKGALIPMLLFAQDEVGAVTPELIDEVSQRLKVKRVEVEEVIGYYTMLTREPRGKQHIQICTNVSCMLTGGEELYEHACKKLGIGNKQKTTDGQFSLEEVECLGACSWAPAMLVNYDFHFNVTPEKLDRLIESLKKTQ
ncbi:NAD(P)H-dependent oxidoreductase subunit E [uncultured Paludibaculum sp.]|uniref:NADH-quinone oxidoreductase subunit NuoE family protein n=1 Tax=uncultured Paludibaculum sp. TaxID=1765020 RepID=UPI002AAB8A7C|nr:NAD(P)H-dependent oxidoreductase subunit E [uncultured Paludibaculum sp.]